MNLYINMELDNDAFHTACDFVDFEIEKILRQVSYELYLMMESDGETYEFDMCLKDSNGNKVGTCTVEEEIN
jgi:hypothetical protein